MCRPQHYNTMTLIYLKRKSQLRTSLIKILEIVSNLLHPLEQELINKQMLIGVLYHSLKVSNAKV